jgi:EAL domain-containing protein (putative c-di-GMP-specific phosphodiesterase class I)
MPAMPLSFDDTQEAAKVRQRRHDEDAARRRLRRDLATAVSRGSFLLQFQPRVSLASGQQTGAEALLRWPNGPRGLVSPGAFLPLAAEAGLAGAIGTWVLQAACKAAVQWPHELPVAVNVSPEQLACGGLAAQVTAALDASGLCADRLELELPESLAADAEPDTLLRLAALRDLGVGLVLDDFGAAHGNLTALRRLPLTAVKLDGCVVRGLPGDCEDAAMARITIQMAHALGLSVTAEGIETEAQRACLAVLGCDDGQGFLFSLPLPADRMAARRH